jgi:3,4-dihydroxy 2-butanone 4-phosphate synthase/GTP cyclohydrolase II
MNEPSDWVEKTSTHRRRTGRPYVTLTYAQSLDGAIAAHPGHPLALSCRDSQALTHTLRARHDAILIGIGTVLADNPSLTVRLASGNNPQPVILDSRLRFPLYAKLLRQQSFPWIMTSKEADSDRQTALEQMGAKIHRLASGDNGSIEIKYVLEILGAKGINSLMVEGGAQVIASFLGCQAVDQVIITIAPVLVGGVRVLDFRQQPPPKVFPRLIDVEYQRIGEDLIVYGKPDWGS